VSDARELLSAELVAALEALIDERLELALARNGSPWLTVAEAAELLHVSPRTLARMLEAGRYRSTLVGRRRLVRREDLERGDG
jgi:excisionase family DNA binding protein